MNDTRSAAAARDLIRELGGGDKATGHAAWASAISSVPIASLTVTKLRKCKAAKKDIYPPHS